jgi:ribonuclease VapC
MALNIKDRRTEESCAGLPTYWPVDHRGCQEAAEEKLQAIEADKAGRKAALRAFIERARALPNVDPRTDDEIPWIQQAGHVRLIVVDSSALVAIHLAESEAEEFSDLIADDDAPRASTFTVFETRTVLSFRGGIAKLREFDAWLRVARVVAVAFDEQQSMLAFDAYQRWARQSPAGLNLGDCAAYALAKSLDAPLLFKGTDFARTDVRRAI